MPFYAAILDPCHLSAFKTCSSLFPHAAVASPRSAVRAPHPVLQSKHSHRLKSFAQRPWHPLAIQLAAAKAGPRHTRCLQPNGQRSQVGPVGSSREVMYQLFSHGNGVSYDIQAVDPPEYPLGCKQRLLDNSTVQSLLSKARILCSR